MPGLTGTEALAVFKEIPGFNIPIVITTANQQPGVREKYAEAGFDDYLAKPLVKSDLCFILNKFLNKDGNVQTLKNENDNFCYLPMVNTNESFINWSTGCRQRYNLKISN